MSARIKEMAHDFVYGKKARDGSDYRQVKANGLIQMSYDSETIWSYNTILATINRDKECIIMYENTRDWSNTSREHYYSLLEAIPYNYTIYYRRRTIKETINYGIYEIDRLLKLQVKARVRDYRDEILLIIDNLYNYLHFINYDKRKSGYKDITKRLDLVKLSKDKLKDIIDESNRVEGKRQDRIRRQNNMANIERRQKELSKILRRDYN